MIDSTYQIRPGKKVSLSKFPTDDTGKFASREKCEAATDKLLKRLIHLQEILYAGKQRALLIIFQAMDAGGKDGAIRKVFSGVNPQGCSVTSFGVPTAPELARDFLWRIHAAAPARGMIGIFNRSHYESVLVERVKNLVPKSAWSKRYDHINEFEKLLSDEGTTIVKFYLHISQREQKERLQARLDDPTKRWKFNPGDLEERKRWPAYMKAFDDALERCSTPHAPWYVVPADKKWFRNWVIAETLVRTLEDLNLKYPPVRFDLAKIKIR